MEDLSLLNLYRKIKDGSATENDKIQFELLMGLQTVDRSYVIQCLEKQL